MAQTSKTEAGPTPHRGCREGLGSGLVEQRETIDCMSVVIVIVIVVVSLSDGLVADIARASTATSTMT